MFCLKNATANRFQWLIVLSIAIVAVVLDCESPPDHGNALSKSVLPKFDCSGSKDTLRELISQGAMAAVAWHLSDSMPPLDSLLSAIDRAGFTLLKNDHPFDSADCSLLIKTVYQVWAIAFDPHDTTVAGFLPQTVFREKKGSCLGTALLFLLCAERYDYPVHGVVLPGHFFLRVDFPTGRRNIEPNARGVERSDEYYRRQYGISTGSWFYPLRGLSKKESAAVFFYMLGNACREKGRIREAEHCYKTALSLFPDYPDALGNLALVFQAAEKSDSALILLDRVAALNPDDRKIWANKGSLLLQKGCFQEAIDMSLLRLAVTPDDAELLYICGLAAVKTRRYEVAREMAGRFAVLGDWDRVRELERLLAMAKR
jgi:tetratricopeptide (TPR) repeat protein